VIMSTGAARSWYRDEAQRFRGKALSLKNDNDYWRDSCLRLARAYERIADVLEDDGRRGIQQRSSVSPS
jgi:predicted HicB family RNase H-like nuclease